MTSRITSSKGFWAECDFDCGQLIHNRKDMNLLDELGIEISTVDKYPESFLVRLLCVHKVHSVHLYFFFIYPTA